MTEQERILNRVKKMMALANDAGATEGERDNALRMAYAALRKHNLEMTDVDGHAIMKPGSADEKREDIGAQFISLHWARVVSMMVGELFFCTYYYSHRRGSAEVTHHFVGRTANATTAAAMAEYVCRSISKEGKKFSRNHPSPGAAHRDFCKGAMLRITRRIGEMRKSAEAEKPAAGASMALVVKDFYAQEKEKNAQALVALGLTMKASGPSGRSATNADAYSAGHAYGGKINLDRQIGGGVK
jgi:hypothetical protein